MAEPDDRRDGAPPKHIHIEKKPVNWLAWVALALGILALLLALSRCGTDETVAATPVAADNGTDIVATTADADRSTALVGTAGLGTFLAGTDATPRSFTFEKLNFDTAKSEIRAADAAEVTAVATTLKQYPNSRIRIAGYADARGSSEANVALGKARADSVKAALVGEGIDAGRIETTTGGEANPTDTNATTGGQAENRRTELVVTQR